MIRPMHDRLIVKRSAPETVSAGGIVIPDAAAEVTDSGEVLAIGTGKVTDDGRTIPVTVKVGDRVLFGKYAGQTVKIKGESLVVMRESDVMGILE